MLKPRSLAAALAGAVPDLATDPDRFQCYVERGRLVARATPGLGFEYHYQLAIFVLDYAGEPDAILFPLLQWLRVNQPEQLLNPELRDDALRFEVDLLDQHHCNISIEIQLTETVTAAARDDGGYDLTHGDEPGPVDGEAYAILKELGLLQPGEQPAALWPPAAD